MTRQVDKNPAYPELLRSGDTMLQRDMADYAASSAANIQNYIGMSRIPVGIAGPVDVHGDHAKGRFFIPMATTESRLVASTSRGMKVINECGACA